MYIGKVWVRHFIFFVPNLWGKKIFDAKMSFIGHEITKMQITSMKSGKS